MPGPSRAGGVYPCTRRTACPRLHDRKVYHEMASKKAKAARAKSKAKSGRGKVGKGAKSSTNSKKKTKKRY